MAEKYHLTRVSTNSKTGPIPVSTTSARTCPPACPFKKSGCYAEGGPLALHWRKITEGERGTDFAQFLAEIRALPVRQLWRHNQAGDLPGKGNRIDSAKLAGLASANKGRLGFTYTHKPLTAHNLKAIRKANKDGFTVNLSANGLKHAQSLLQHGLPIVTVLPIGAPTLSHTEDGTPVLVCPATRKDSINCANCGICQFRNRKIIIGFPAHGASRRKADTIAKGEIA